jgi:hypothetical protein
MTSATHDHPKTVLDLLITPGEDSPGILAEQLMSPDVYQNLGRALENVPGSLRETAVRETAKVAAGQLDINLVGLLAEGWRKHQDVIAAARRTVAAPGSVELVDLVAHKITATQRPAIAVLVDGSRLATVQLGVSVVFDVSAVVAGIRAGRLAALHSGRCLVTVTLTVQETEVMTRQARLDLPGVIPLGPGIRLLPGHSYPAGPDSAVSVA